MSSFNHMNSFLRFCVDNAGNHCISGRVFSQRLTEPLDFSDLGSLVLRLEDVFDRQNFPQAFQRSRTFLQSTGNASIAAPEPEQGMAPEFVRSARGAVATFDVQVISRRSSSWQGYVDWMDGTGRQEFVSYLELMRMIDERMFSKSN